MNTSARLYERLEQIPQDPTDPESLEDLVVCAFGAFERYYVCWKTRGGEYRQDSYDLPQSLQEWLFPTDGTTRDFASLQVVFGRGDEYFASDQNSKLEYKEPELKKPETPVEATKEFEKPALRRSRTISFIRPTSDSISRPPSITSIETSTASTSEISTRSRTSSVSSQPSLRSQRFSMSRPTSDPTIYAISPVTESPTRDPQPTPTMPPIPHIPPTRTKTRPLSMSFNSNTFPKIVEGKALTPGKPSPPAEMAQMRPKPEHCTFGCHDRPLPRFTYADASVQTDPEPAPRTALRIDTTSDSSSIFSRAYDSAIPEYDTPLSEIEVTPGPGSAPVIMGRMMDYFSNPGYRLGDSLSSMYSYYPQQPVYQEEYVEYKEGWEDDGFMGQQQMV
ncbi:hypothetical protein BDV96DRAFT_645663 [Lophiotrema nucula]|uniref:Uncharacterized protein n=1 Tax=Lophiotrema nucula TaxID=690887 RepID=A0A6A5ZBN8_9PLEO|nr:hypothetical protein BDV96DRAFT_645663 [Lophiotrema nucula]